MAFVSRAINTVRLQFLRLENLMYNCVLFDFYTSIFYTQQYKYKRYTISLFVITLCVITIARGVTSGGRAGPHVKSLSPPVKDGCLSLYITYVVVLYSYIIRTLQVYCNKCTRYSHRYQSQCRYLIRHFSIILRERVTSYLSYSFLSAIQSLLPRLPFGFCVLGLLGYEPAGSKTTR